MRDARRHDIAVLGRPGRRFEDFRQRLRAVLAVEQAPGVDRAGHRRRVRRLHADLADLALGVPFDMRLGRRPPGAAQRDRRRAVFRIEDKAVAADPGAFRLDDALHRHRRDRRIDRVAAGAQDVERGQRRERVRGRRHAVRRHRRRAAGYIEVAHLSRLSRSSNWRAARAAQCWPAGLPLVPPLWQGSSLAAAFLNRDNRDDMDGTVAVSGRDGARAGRGHPDRARRLVARMRLPFALEPYQSVADRGRAGLDRGRYRLHAARDAARRGSTSSPTHLRRTADPAGHRDPFPPRPYRHGRLADRALAGAACGSPTRNGCTRA